MTQLVIMTSIRYIHLSVIYIARRISFALRLYVQILLYISQSWDLDSTGGIFITQASTCNLSHSDVTVMHIEVKL